MIAVTELFMYSKEEERESLALALRNRDPEVLGVLIGRFQFSRDLAPGTGTRPSLRRSIEI
jgi:hypothetical protein